MRSLLLPIAIVLGIVLPGATLGLFALQGWSLPTWLAVSLPIVFIGSVRGTVVLLGWKAFRRYVPRWWESRKRARAAKEDSTPTP